MSYKNMEDGEDKEELIDKTASIYGHALRYSKSDADRFQIHDRLAALKVCMFLMVVYCRGYSMYIVHRGYKWS